MNTQKEHITHYSKNLTNVMSMHGADSEYTNYAFFLLQGVKIGIQSENLFSWAASKCQELNQDAISLNFEIGTPATFPYNGRIVSGEVGMNRDKLRLVNGQFAEPRSVKGIFLYIDENYSGIHDRFVVPANWGVVKNFYQNNL